MADDGLLLNFATPQDVFIFNKPSFRGGRWRDRLLAKKGAKRRQSQIVSLVSKPEYVHNDPNINSQLQNIISIRATKRQRVENSNLGTNENKVVQLPRSNSTAAVSVRPAIAEKTGQVISSLFTSNPIPNSQPDGQKDLGKDETVEASNAPLNEDAYNFTSLGISADLATHLTTKLDIKAPTAIQEATIPHLLQSKDDAFIRAETGSGKTLAYLLPIVQRIMNLRGDSLQENTTDISRQSGLFAIFLAPTRELCKQIAVVLENVLRCCHSIVPGAISGGEKKKSEKARLRKGINMLVATPGRLMDHIQHTEVFDLSNVRWLVLDEGDRLMELGFEEQIQRIIGQLNIAQTARKSSDDAMKGLPDKRINVLCSATLRMDVNKLGDMSLKNAKHIQSTTTFENKPVANGDPNCEFSVPAQLRQSYALVPAKLRLVTLIAFLKQNFSRRGSVMKAIIFVSCADSVDFHFSVLSQVGDNMMNEGDKAEKREVPKVKNKFEVATMGVAVAVSSETNQVAIYKLHGSLPQNVRKSTLASFSTSTEPVILICTDVASRGLDVPNVDLIIEYDPPFCKDDHLHRIGRTARAGRDGRAIIFLQPGDEEKYIEILKQSQREASRNLTRHSADEILKKGFLSSKNNNDGRSFSAKATDWQLDVERWALDNEKYLEQARRAYQSHVRAYATHVSDERDMFNIKNLHLGHLAKAFALRDKPKSIRVPGLRPGNDIVKATNAERKSTAKGRAINEQKSDKVNLVLHSSVAAQKMKAKLKERVSDAAEFNLG